jgi:hypothetical protein
MVARVKWNAAALTNSSGCWPGRWVIDGSPRWNIARYINHGVA